MCEDLDNNGGHMEKKSENKEKSFYAETLIKSKSFREQRDILEAVLCRGEKYTKSEAKRLAEKYLKKEMS